MSNHRFSIIIACGHSAESLSATLEAISKLDYEPGFEVIVVDDGSQKGRKQVVEKAISREQPVRYLQFQGISRPAAWNIAVRESSCEFLAFLDDDCLPLPGWLTAYDKDFDKWTAGVIGGPDRAPVDANFLECCVDYVLTSFVGTLGLRAGHLPGGKYYPRTWNMATRKEAVVLAGGFDEDDIDTPEVAMIHRMDKIGYRAGYQPKAMLWHYRRVGLSGFLLRDFQLGMQRSRKDLQPGMNKLYTTAILVICTMLLFTAYPMTRDFGLWMLKTSSYAYMSALVISGIHSGIHTRSPLAVIFVPILLAMHHASHFLGYTFGASFVRMLARWR